MDMKLYVALKKFDTWCSLMTVALNTWCLNGFAVELWRIAHTKCKEEHSKWLKLTPSMRATSVSWDRPAEWSPPPATSMEEEARMRSDLLKAIPEHYISDHLHAESSLDNQGHSVDSDEVGLAKRRVLKLACSELHRESYASSQKLHFSTQLPENMDS
eukprot:6139310-Amphidinium_carterae.1